MSPGRLTVLLTLLLAVTVPWPFFDKTGRVWFGFPDWAFYSFCATLVYAVVVALLIDRLWKQNQAGEDSDE